MNSYAGWMERLPFDSSKMAAKKVAGAVAGGGGTSGGSGAVGSGAKGSGQAPVMTVSQLSAKIEGVLRDGMSGTVRVVGEVSGFRERTHWYFDIKDENAVVNCVMFQSAARRALVAIENGMEVVVRGKVEYYAKQGRVTVIVEQVEPVGAGALDAAFRALVEEVRGAGWLDPARKRSVPKFPSRVAVVTSRSAAALQDVLVTMRKRCTLVGVVLCDVRVQGDGAAAEIRGAIDEVSRRSEELGIDVVIVTRGGGSKEDLWCFNDRGVAESIVKCRVPVVAAIGHETDVTLAELVADERCATPTQAAMRVTPEAEELLRQLASLEGRMESQVRRLISYEQRRVEQLAGRGVMRDPAVFARRAEEVLEEGEERLEGAMSGLMEELEQKLLLASARLERHRPEKVNAERRARLSACEQRLEMAARRMVEVDLAGVSRRLVQAGRVVAERAGSRLASAERALHVVSPVRVLERGFSVTMRADGKAVRRAGDVKKGETLKTRVADGEIESVVDGGRVVPLRKKGKKEEEGKGGLFGE
jgi:exodeoxyribonuclease VII large subunit